MVGVPASTGGIPVHQGLLRPLLEVGSLDGCWGKEGNLPG